MANVIIKPKSSQSINESPIDPQTNLKKRKLDELEYNLDSVDNNTEPDRKKRKLNTLFESNESLKKTNNALKEENNALIKERNEYKKERNKWKSQYMKLYSQLIQLTNPDIANNVNVNFERNNTNQSNHNKYDSVRNQSPQFVFDELINTCAITPINPIIINTDHTNNTNNNHNTNNCNTHSYVSESSEKSEKSDNDNDSDFIAFEDSYLVSVNCHICEQHFDDIYVYRDHLQQHYDNDPNKTWRQCDLGKTCHHKAQQDLPFLRHISTHTNDKPYTCNITTNGIKCDARRGYKGDLKKHWKSHFHASVKQKSMKNKKKTKNNKNKNKNKTKNKKNKIKIKKEIKSKREKENKNKIMRSIDESEYIEFEDSFHFSVHCHICKMHFDKYEQYIHHMENHYNIDPNKTWKQCDFGCVIDPIKPFFRNPSVFISHIAQHTLEKPYHCDVVINGKKCQSLFGQRKNLRSHWQIHFEKPQNQKKNKKNALKIKIEKQENLDFEHCYYVSVNCHLCNKHFDNIEQYKEDIKQHYENHPFKIWLKCDFGCKQDMLFPNSSAFIGHIASHTKDYPFKCNYCQMNSGTKNNLKKHWNLRHNENDTDTESDTDSDSDSDSDSESSSYSSSYSSTYSSCYSSSCESESESESGTESESESERETAIQKAAFEKSYVISVDCHICNKHFDNFTAYRDHIRQHYIEDPNKTWKECDFGCMKHETGVPIVSGSPNNFIKHIGMHTKAKPFKCNVTQDGIKCSRSMTSKDKLKKHWKLNHFKQKSKDERKPIKTEPIKTER